MKGITIFVFLISTMLSAANKLIWDPSYHPPIETPEINNLFLKLLNKYRVIAFKGMH